VPLQCEPGKYSSVLHFIPLFEEQEEIDFEEIKLSSETE
jgi:hypothetical protein